MTVLEHSRATCGGPAWCWTCNARMIEREGAALREAVAEAIRGERRTDRPEPDERVFARVERWWRDSRVFRERYRGRRA